MPHPAGLLSEVIQKLNWKQGLIVNIYGRPLIAESAAAFDSRTLII